MGIGINSTLIGVGMELELIPGKGRNGPLSVGGYLGLFLGGSILGALDFIEKILLAKFY